MKHCPKDPDAILDYGVDYTDWLIDGDTISDSSWTVPTGITSLTDTHTTTETTIWLSGGTAGTEYVITNHVITVGGRHDDRSIAIKVMER